VKRHLFAVAMLLAGSAFAQQRTPEISFTSVPEYPNLPAGMNFGEVPGVAVNSRGHVFVFSRSNSANGPAFGAAAAQLFEFDQKGNFVREIGKDLYASDSLRRTRDRVPHGAGAVRRRDFELAGAEAAPALRCSPSRCQPKPSSRRGDRRILSAAGDFIARAPLA
jgi:hypothetical protein